MFADEMDHIDKATAIDSAFVRGRRLLGREANGFSRNSRLESEERNPAAWRRNAAAACDPKGDGRMWWERREPRE